MPKLKTREEPFADVSRLLKGYDMTGVRLAGVLGKSEFTARQRIKFPADLTLGELDLICKRGHIPAEKLREAIKFC